MPNFYSGWLAPPNGFAKYRLRLTVNVESQDVNANTSTVYWESVLEKDRSQNGFWNYNASWNVTIDGVAATSNTGKMPPAPWTGWGTWHVATGRSTIAHNPDGTKTIGVNAQFAGANTAWSIGGPIVANDSMALPTLARATTPAVSASPAFVGQNITVSLPRASTSFTHDVTWVAGSLSGVIGTGVGDSVAWTTPSVMGEYPGQALVPIVITAVTKNAGVAIGSRQVTLFAKAVPVAPVPGALGELTANRQFDVRARLVLFSGGEWSARSVIPAEKIQLVDPYSATATCSISMSKINAVDFADDSVIDIDVFNGTDWIFTNHRFALSRVQNDDVDPTQMHEYSGTEFVDYSLGFAYTQRDYEWTNWNPASFIGDPMGDAFARGWGPRIGFEFNSNVTSLNEPWANNGLARKVGKGTPLSQILDGVVADGLCEYRTEYRSGKGFLVLLNPGTGSDYSADGASPVVNLALAPLSRAPRRSTSEKRLTRVTAAGDEEAQATRERAPFNPNVFGHMEGWVAATGTTGWDTAWVAQYALNDNSGVVNERTFEYSSQNASPQFYPYAVFRPGDWVLRPDGDNTVKDRISQITIDKQADGATMLTVLTGDRILSGTARLAKRQAAQNGGSIAGGNQSAPAPLDSRIPASPVVATVTSLGYWNTDGAAKSNVTMTWGPVTQAVNGAAMRCDLYEVWWRPAGTGTEWTYRSSTAEASIQMSGWDVLQSIELRVRGRSLAGVYGEFSEDQTHITLAPPVDLSGPIIADMYTDGVGSIYIVWAGVLGTTLAPRRLAYVVAEVSGNAGATYTTMGTPIPGAGTIVVNPGAYGEYRVRIRGYDRLGNAGDASLAQDISLIDPRVAASVPTSPTGLVATAGAGWDASGFLASAWFDLAWTAPTVDVNGDPVTIVGYDVWGKKNTETALRFLTTSSTAQVRVEVGSNEGWSFQVSATSNFGGVSPLSSPVVAVANASIAAPTAPTAPVLSQYAGLLRVQWAGGGMVPQIKYAFASISTSANGTYTRAGMPLIGAGEAVVPGLATGVTYFAKINLVDERGQVVASAASAGLQLTPITGITVETSPLANTGIKMTTASLTSYDVSGNPTFILNAATGEVWIAPYDSVFDLGASGTVATTGAATTGIAISSQNSSFNTFIHASGVEIRNDQIPLSWWEADASDASLVNFFSPRAVIGQRMLMGDFEFTKELKSTGSRLVIRYKGA